MRFFDWPKFEPFEQSMTMLELVAADDVATFVLALVTVSMTGTGTGKSAKTDEPIGRGS